MQESFKTLDHKTKKEFQDSMNEFAVTEKVMKYGHSKSFKEMPKNDFQKFMEKSLLN